MPCCFAIVVREIEKPKPKIIAHAFSMPKVISFSTVSRFSEIQPVQVLRRFYRSPVIRLQRHMLPTILLCHGKPLARLKIVRATKKKHHPEHDPSESPGFLA